MQKTNYKSEEDICELIVKWLRAQHWEVYQEVSLGYASERADIVAKLGSLLWVIEAKRNVSMKLLEQSLNWIGYANMISMASLGGKKRTARLLNWFWRQTGIGLITICPISDGVDVRYEPRLYRIKHNRLKDSLCEEQKNFCAAGSKDGGYWTPYAQTCREVLSRVKREPGITMKQLMDGLEHHYSSSATARACLTKWAAMGKIPGVKVERDGKMNRFFPDTEENKR
jgi:hypothetical protein